MSCGPQLCSMGSHLIDGVIDGVDDGVDALSLRYVGGLSTLDDSDGDNNNGIDDGLMKADERPGPKAKRMVLSVSALFVSDLWLI